MKSKFNSKDNSFGLSAESVLYTVSAEEIYRHYLGDYDINVAMSAPYREDKNPSFALYYNNKNELKWTDFGRKNEGGNVFQLLKKIYNLRYGEVLTMIDRDMNLNIENFSKNKIVRYPHYIDKIKEREEVVLQRLIQDYTLIDKHYWSSGNVSKKTLEFFGIRSTAKIYLNSVCIWKYTQYNPIYSWEIQGKIKGYRPLESNKKIKWISNCNENIIQGYGQLPTYGDLLIITKSMKDVAVYYELGIPAIAPQSESILIEASVYNELADRFTHIITNFDPDEAGDKLTESYKEAYKLKGFNFREKNVKDAFEFSSVYGLRELEEFTNKKLKL
jgi:hypothetical protein